MRPEAVTIVGASLAGLRAAEALRRSGFGGPITFLGDEAQLPYDRPPLSKQVLAGEWDADRVQLTTPDKYAALELESELGVVATGFDLVDRKLTLGDGRVVEVDGLVIATGSRCRTLPGTEGMRGVHVLRTLDDCLALRADLDATPARVVVIGAGFIGAEVAATTRSRGLDVTMIEADQTPLGRVLGPEMGEVCGAVHRDHGVDLRTGVGVVAIEGGAEVTAVALSDGSRVEADVAVVGIGVVPNTEWLDGSGLTIDDGVVCDETGLAADRVVAAGDVARWPSRRFGELMRVEHWDNAAAQGAHVGRRLVADDGDAEVYDPVPWFWSDQYDRKIQLAGRVGPDDRVEVVSGTVAERRFVALYGRAGRLTGVLGFNRPRHVMQYRNLIEQGATFEQALSAEI
jgi:3-phenylpropionate/trans-cinnamate dioxygenase ferredoxin reductase subunit